MLPGCPRVRTRQVEAPAGYPLLPLPLLADFATHVGRWAALYGVAPWITAAAARLVGFNRTVARLRSSDRELEQHLRRMVVSRRPGPAIAYSATAVLVDEPTPPAPVAHLSHALDRAARLMRAADDFRRDYLAGRLLPEQHRGRPVDLSQFRNLFASSFGYADGTLRLCTTDSVDCYAVVFCLGRAWRVLLADVEQGAPVSVERLVTQLRAIVAASRPLEAGWGAIGPAHLTALEPPQTEAGLRDLMAADPSRETLQTILGAQFVVCLDLDATPASPAACGAVVHSGNPGNRWYLAASNLVVCGNGKAGWLFNYTTGVDGNVMVRFAAETAQRAAGMPPGLPAERGDSSPVALSWGSSDSVPRMWRALERARLASLFAYRRALPGVHRLPVGRRDLEAAGLSSVDAFVIALLSALRLQTGDAPPVYQMVSRSHYRYCPLAFANLATPESAAFGSYLEESIRLDVPLSPDAWPLYARAEQAARNRVRDVRDCLTLDPTELFSSSWDRATWTRAMAIATRVERLMARRAPSAGAARLCESLTISHAAIHDSVTLVGRPGGRAGHPPACWAHYQIRLETTDVILVPGAACRLSEPLLIGHLQRALVRLVEMGRIRSCLLATASVGGCRG